MKKANLLGLFFALLMVFLVSSSTVASATRRSHDGGSQSRRDISGTSTETGQENSSLLFMGELLEGVRIHSPLSDELNTLYLKNRAEIHQIIDRNPGIIWKTVDLLLELLPALRSVDQNGGKLNVEKKLYARATDFWGGCESLASPQLADDLRKAKSLIESRTTELDSYRLQIDLTR